MARPRAGILFVLASGVPWAMPPEELVRLGDDPLAQAARLQRAGAWAELHRVPLDRLGEAHAIGWKRCSPDRGEKGWVSVTEPPRDGYSPCPSHGEWSRGPGGAGPPMPHEGSAPDLAEVEAMIEDAEAELDAVCRRLERHGRVPAPSDPADPVACLEIWLAALRAHRARLAGRLD